MHIRTLLFIIILGAIGALAALNWTAFNTPTTLWLGVTTVEAPLGLVMLGFIALLTAFFLGVIIHLQSSVLLEARRHAKELQVHRERADQAEASRFSDLRQLIELEMQSANKHNVDMRIALMDRMDKLDSGIATAIEQSGNSVAAHIGELEDRLERGGTVVPNRLA